MKALFLDFDGVLNDATLDARSQAYWDLPLQEKYVDRLNRICDATGAKVVLSTTWRSRGEEACRGWLDRARFYGEVVGETPDLSVPCGPYPAGAPPRWREIKEWLDGHPEVDGYVILDDIADMGPLAEHHVCSVDGLTEADADKAIEILRGAP